MMAVEESLGYLDAKVRVLLDERSYRRSVKLNEMLASGVKRVVEDGFVYEVKLGRPFIRRVDHTKRFRIERHHYLDIKPEVDA